MLQLNNDMDGKIAAPFRRLRNGDLISENCFAYFWHDKERQGRDPLLCLTSNEQKDSPARERLDWTGLVRSVMFRCDLPSGLTLHSSSNLVYSLDIHIDCTRLVILYKMRVSNNYNEKCMNGRYARRKTTTQHKKGWAGDARTSAAAYSNARTVNGIEGTVTSTAGSRPPPTSSKGLPTRAKG